MGLTVVLLLCSVVVVGVGGASVADLCGNDVQKVQMCLAYATGQAAAPSQECCTAVVEMKNSKPVCLCYVIQQVHKGNEQLKSLGIQEARLLQLPSACKLTNASTSDCPKLLNIPVGSPDYAIFANSSSSAAATTPGTATASPTTTANSGGSKSVVLPQLAGLVAISVAVLLYAFPVEAELAFYT